MNSNFWRGRRVLLTGHTGFKGSWLAAWLGLLGAQTTGFALPPNTDPSLFHTAKIEQFLSDSRLDDVQDFAAVEQAFRASRPEIVFHLAAQPLVHRSYDRPLETFAVNALGTAHVLECARFSAGLLAVVVITTDKVYKDQDTGVPFSEDDRLGGNDPYSASKACAELIVKAYRKSYFGDATPITTVRAGNVIGGGDWSADRLLPDIIRAWRSGEALHVRRPDAVRPWQHVLEPLRVYLELAERLATQGAEWSGCWNVGPAEEDCLAVRDIVAEAERMLGPRLKVELDDRAHPHETPVLRLDSSRTRLRLGCAPLLRVADALEWTFAWHRAEVAGEDMTQFTLAQLNSFAARATPVGAAT